MKKISLLLIAILYFSANIIAQDAVATQVDIENFHKSKTYVILDENIFENYNDHIKEAVKTNWTVTDYEVAKLTDFLKHRRDSKYSFIIRTTVSYEKDKSRTEYTFLSLLLGNVGASSIARMPDLISFPLSYRDVDYDKYTYKLGAIVKFMQNHANLLKKDPSISSKNVLKYYNKNTKKLANKTLYVLKDELANNCNSLAKIKKFYSGKVKIVDKEKIKDIIINNEKDAVFLHKVGPSKKNQKMRIYKLILSPDGHLYYFNFHKYKKGKKEDAFLSKDFSKL